MKNKTKKSLFSIFYFLFSTPRRGFTIVEMIVAIGLFSVMVSIAAGGFVNALRGQRQVASLIAADNNVSLTLEQMAREFRTGYKFCRPSCAPSEINFINSNSAAITYRLSAGTIERIEDGGAAQPVTGGNVNVQYLNFILSGNLSGDRWPPRITISLGVSPREAVTSGIVVNLQTTVSARQLDT